MSYDPMVKIAIAMSKVNVSEGLDAVNNTEPNQAQITCRLPKDMRPSKDAFEFLGFTFENIDDDILCQVTLPEGWKIKSDGGYWATLIDEKDRKRGRLFYKGTSFYERSGHMTLSPRYYVNYEYTKPKNYKSPVNVLVKDSAETILFTAGQCAKPFSEEYEKLRNKAIEYLKNNYPEWENPTKYWD